MKVFRWASSVLILLVNLLTLGCLSCYAIPHQMDTPCHEMGHHHSEECSMCQITDKAWNMNLANSQNKEEEYLKDSPEPRESLVIKNQNQNYLVNEKPIIITIKRPDPWVSIIAKTVVMRL